MSEPLSRGKSDFVKAVEAEAALIAKQAAVIAKLRARVAELEKDEALRGPRLQALADMSDRALSAEAGLAAAQEALKGLTEAARQVVHADGILSDPEATDAQQVTASQVETEGIMLLAEILVSDALARGGGHQETG